MEKHKWRVGLWGWGSALCDVILQGVLRFVTKCDEGGEGSKIGQNRVTSFMDGPIAVSGDVVLTIEFIAGADL